MLFVVVAVVGSLLLNYGSVGNVGILNLFAKKKGQLLRASSVGKHTSTRVDEGRKS